MRMTTERLPTHNGASLVVEWLQQRQIRLVFLVPGGQIAALLDALASTDQIQVIVANHELGAAYMADGYARATKKIAVCISIGGPGASNMLTAAITARMDNSRVLFITGNVPVDLQGIGAFQDGGSSACRDSALFSAALQHTANVTTAEELITQLNQAWDAILLHTAPAHLSIPKNILAQHSAFSCVISDQPHPDISAAKLHKVIAALNKVKKILIVVGQRLYTQESAQLLMLLAETYALPMVTTLGAKGVIAETSPFNLGNFGYGGNTCADAIVFTEKIDLLLILGTDLNERDTLGWDKRLNAPGRVLVRIDTVSTPASHPYQPDIEFITDSFSALVALINADKILQPLSDSAAYRMDWLNTLTANKPVEETPIVSFSNPAIPLISLIQTLQQRLPDDSILVADAGMHRKLSGRYWQVKQSNTFFNPATTAPMGWGLAAAIGIQLANKQQQVVAITGDGCMRMHGMELATAARYQIPIIFIICNNAAYAATASYLQPKNYSMVQLPTIDWVGFAAAIGINGIKVDRQSDLELAIKQTQTIHQPFVIEVITPSLVPKRADT
ncbi:MAG: thiamine pyrophosphate-binding protein [Methylobacter sp.]|nr:thiamine pyrophosphate-binding protein [Candidatus Methylobacter titanis]